VTPLASQFDMILGCPFLARCNPVIDWQTGVIGNSQLSGPPVVVHVLFQPEHAVELISAHQLMKERSCGEEVLLCHVRLADEENEMPKGFPSEPGPAADFVRENLDIFRKPSGLPPLRHINHKIE